MKRTLADIRENLDHVGCDNATALEMCAEIERLRAALKECADDLAIEIASRYKDSAGDIHPALLRRYERDMEPVHVARRALEQTIQEKS